VIYTQPELSTGTPVPDASHRGAHDERRSAHGNASFVFSRRPAQRPDVLMVGIVWQFLSNGATVYATGLCARSDRLNGAEVREA